MPLTPAGAAASKQAAGNGIAGAIGFKLSEWLPRAIERRRARRGMRVSR